MESRKKSPEARALRSRLNYIQQRLAELNEEKERLRNERQTLRAKIGAGKRVRAAKKA